MTRHLLAAALAALMLASPAIALAQAGAPAGGGTTSTYSDTAPKKAKAKTTKAKTTKATPKAKKSKKATASK